MQTQVEIFRYVIKIFVGITFTWFVLQLFVRSLNLQKSTNCNDMLNCSRAFFSSMSYNFTMPKLLFLNRFNLGWSVVLNLWRGTVTDSHSINNLQMLEFVT